MNSEVKAQLKSALFSYIRAAAAAVLALVLAGVQDGTAITITALVAGALGPLVRALDPTDDAYGIGAKVAKAHELAKTSGDEVPATETDLVLAADPDVEDVSLAEDTTDGDPR